MPRTRSADYEYKEYKQPLQEQWANQWTKMFERLQAYQQEHNGSCDVPQTYDPDQQLGYWVSNQRKFYKRGLLAKERRDQLVAIGFQWTRCTEWNEMLKRLQAYQQEDGGSSDVPQKYGRDPQLGKWINKQRYSHKRGWLTKERYDQLVAIGFQWRCHPEWTEMLKRLQVYQQKHNGSSEVPREYRQDPQLGSWVNKQRHNYKKGLLSKERYDQLEQIGFRWTGDRLKTFQDKWTIMLKSLQAYQQEHNGNCNVPQSYRPDPPLGRWVCNQRRFYRQGLLSKENCDQLEAIGFEFNPNHGQSYQDQWTKMFKRLQTYQQEHNGSCSVPQRYPQDQQLGTWVTTQRYSYKKGGLAKERCDQLEAIGFEWTHKREQSSQDQWAKMLKRLQAYQQEHNGSCEVPSKYPPDQPLSTWVSNQRLIYKKGLLTKDRFDQLEGIGFEWTRKHQQWAFTHTNCQHAFQDKWAEMLKRLEAYQQEHNGSCNVPQSYGPDPQLGRWVGTQRHRYKKGLLAKERCDQLADMDFEWTLNRKRASTQLQPPLTVSKTKQQDTPEPLRMCWL